MDLISSQVELKQNIEQLARYLDKANTVDAEFARDLIRNGVCFVVTFVGSKEFCAPSRFIGYKNNNRDAHLKNDKKDGRDTTPAISELLGSPPTLDDNLEQRYRQFCNSLAIEPRATGAFGVKRKFWDAR